MVHLLNTKNDEHEAFVQKLRSLHETEIERVLKDSASRLQGSQEEATREREAGEKREEEVRSALREVVKERDQLLETQVRLKLAREHSILVALWFGYSHGATRKTLRPPES